MAVATTLRVAQWRDLRQEQRRWRDLHAGAAAVVGSVREEPVATGSASRGAAVGSMLLALPLLCSGGINRFKLNPKPKLLDSYFLPN
jgi:hypothetical protein